MKDGGQGYYRWLADGPCERERTDAELTEQIREIHTELHGHPGVRRVWAELVVRGLRVARKRVWRLMRAAGLQGRHPRAWKRTTVAGQRPDRRPGPDRAGLHRRSSPTPAGAATSPTSQTVDGWVYTATVIDLHSRKVVGYAVADHLRTSLIVEALAAALLTRRPPHRGDLPQRPRLPIHLPGIRRLLRRERRHPLDGAARHMFRL